MKDQAEQAEVRPVRRGSYVLGRVLVGAVLLAGALLVLVIGRSLALVSSLISSDRPQIAAARVVPLEDAGAMDPVPLDDEAVEFRGASEVASPSAHGRAGHADARDQNSRESERRERLRRRVDEDEATDKEDEEGQERQLRQRRPKLPVFDLAARRRGERLRSTARTNEAPAITELPVPDVPEEEEAPPVEAVALGGSNSED